jgi:5-methylcytosine-specific restriction endonuclease McrA
MDDARQSAARPVEPSVPGRTDSSTPRPKAVALAPQRYSFQFTMSQEFHDKLRYAQELTSHRVHRGDLVVVLERAVDAYIAECERRRFAKTTRPRPGRAGAGARHVPAHVRRAVWARDGGQCTFVGDDGHRCGAREPLEFDHIVPVARGGRATADGIRLRCRGHNQFEAERTFGAEFMKHKRDEARRAQEARRAAKEEARMRAAAEAEARRAEKGLARSQAAAAAEARRAEEEARARVRERIDEVIPWLRQLGVRADAARRAAEHADASPDAPLEARVRAALAFHARARFPGCVGPGERRSVASIATSVPCPG